MSDGIVILLKSSYFNKHDYPFWKLHSFCQFPTAMQIHINQKMKKPTAMPEFPIRYQYISIITEFAYDHVCKQLIVFQKYEIEYGVAAVEHQTCFIMISRNGALVSCNCQLHQSFGSPSHHLFGCLNSESE